MVQGYRHVYNYDNLDGKIQFYYGNFGANFGWVELLCELIIQVLAWPRTKTKVYTPTSRTKPPSQNQTLVSNLSSELVLRKTGRLVPYRLSRFRDLFFGIIGVVVVVVVVGI